MSSRRNLFRLGAVTVAAIALRVQPAQASFRDPDNDGDRDRGRGSRRLDTDGDRRHHCFLLGTVISTVSGERKVEDLAAGDLLPTKFGGIRPIAGIGYYRYPRTDAALPVKIARGALAPGIPSANLYVTRFHAILIDGMLIDAGNLVNGTTITNYDPGLDYLEYYHVKLARHDVIYANDCPAETLLGYDETSATDEVPCLPIVRYNYRRGEIASHLRSLVSPIVDLRHPADRIRDRLAALSRI
jgi:hypothetical protein